MLSLKEEHHFDRARLITNTEAIDHSGRVDFLIASILVYAAKSDGSISQPETDKMIETLCTRLGVRNAEAMDHLSRAVMQLADEGNFILKLQQLATALNQEEKESVLDMMLQVAMADGKIEPQEYQAVLCTGEILKLPQDKVYAELRSIMRVSNWGVWQ